MQFQSLSSIENKAKMLILGLTGGIATGKSTVSKRFEHDHNLFVIDADRIAREIVEPGKPAYNKIVTYFGPKVGNLIDPDTKELVRANLGRYVFENKSELQVLNKFTHPQIRKEIFWLVVKSWFSGERMVVLDVPLLYETGMNWYCGAVVSVVCNKEHQLERLLCRNPELSKEDALNRIKSQMPMKEKAALSDYVIQNDGPVTDMLGHVDDLVRRITPGYLQTYLEIFPIWGVCSASYCVFKQWLKFRQTKKSV